LLLFLFSLSGALEHFAMYRTHREIGSLVSAAPKKARVAQPDDSFQEIPIGEVEIGQTVQVKPDELFPIDGVLISGNTAADESNLTGESAPVEKETGDKLYSGTLNLWGSVQLEVTRKAQDSSLQKIIRLIHQAQKQRAPSQRFTDRFGTHYTYLVLAATGLVFAGWWLLMDLPPFFGDEGTPSAFYRAMTFLVVASPCALVLSIPSAILACIARGARMGVLFRGGAPIEKLAEIDCVALDKTGTLTTGELEVVRAESFPPGNEQKVLETAYSLERSSNHPIARAITRYGEKNNLGTIEIREFQSISGQGLRAVSDDEVCFLGRRELFARGDLADILKHAPEPPPSVTEVWVVHRGLIGRILLQDRIRSQSAQVLERFREHRIRTIMLTGDRRSTAEEVGRKLGIEEVRAGLYPEDKVQVIEDLKAEGRKVAMVGDGVNDAPSLAAAYVSAGMGARGSDAALEQSEIVLMNDRIEKFLDAYLLSRKAKSIIRWNLTIALGTVVLMMGTSILGLVPLTVGVIAHEGSTVLVCLNSLRLLFLRLDSEHPER
ncbi:MAG: heavy metal translocating P-type ATPase, partial [Puniceicoccales bacterium]